MEANKPKSIWQKLFPEPFRQTLFLRLFTFWKIPLLSYTAPRVLELSDSRCVIQIPLRRRTKNHLGSMYFAALAAGADCAGGLIAMNKIRQSRQPVSLIFKEFKADFLKRPEGDVNFICEDGLVICEAVQKAIASKERVNLPVNIVARVPKISETEDVAKFVLMLSLKRQN